MDVSSQTDLSRNGLDQPTGEANSGGPLSGLGVGLGYDAFGRLTSAGFPGHESLYQYDTGGRVWKVGDGSQWAEQIYQPNSWLVGEVKHRSAGGALTLHTRRAHDYLGRVTPVENRPGSLEAGTFDREYQFDLGGRRVEEGFPDGSRWRYGYDSRGRLASGRKEWADGGPVAGQQFEYGHDDAGNRTLRRWGGNASGLGLRESVETVNGANQVVSRTNPGSFDVLGLAPATAQVLVNGLASGVSRKGQYYHREVAVSNGAGAVSAAVSVVASEGAQTVGTVNGRQFVAKGVEALEYDAEGNLTRDGRWVYEWDGENRLVGMESVADGPVESRLRLKFEQDWAGRRVRKRVYAWTGGAGGGYGESPVVDVKYVWVGWHLAAELGGANNAVLRSYLWGPDAGGGLAGDLDGAGGVGGLVGVKEGGTLRWAALDGQGNVAGLVGAGDGVAVGWYEYGPYGELLRATGSAGETNPVRYECKLEDRETGLIYYGFRYYHPGLGRWLGKDPMGEAGGLNLYGYVGGDPINGIDPFGLWGLNLNVFLLGNREAWKTMLNPPEWVEDLGGGNYYGAPDPMFGGLNRGGGPGDSDDVQDLIDELERRNSDFRGAAQDMVDTAKAALEITPQNSVCVALTGKSLFDRKVSKGERVLAVGSLGLGAFGSAAKVATSRIRGGTYLLRDPVTGRVMRTGRTGDLARRQGEHARDSILREFQFEVVDRTDDYAKQRGLEQLLHDAHKPPLDYNQPISRMNPNRQSYLDAARKFLLGENQ